MRPLRPDLTASIVTTCALESADPLFERLTWDPREHTITVIKAGTAAIPLARCRIRRTVAGIIAFQDELARGHREQRGYSLLLREQVWRRWDGARQLNDQQLGMELVEWTANFARSRADGPPTIRTATARSPRVSAKKLLEGSAAVPASRVATTKPPPASEPAPRSTQLPRRRAPRR